MLVLIRMLTLSDTNVYLYKLDQEKVKTQVFLSHKQKFHKNIILLAHSSSGCDTTSSCYWKEKVAICKTLIQSKLFHCVKSVIGDPKSWHQQVVKAGRKLFLNIYRASHAAASLNLYTFHASQNLLQTWN